MGMVIGRHIDWRFQGVKSSCWLTCIEMLMQCKYGSIYGNGQTQHSNEAMEAYRANRGSHISDHAAHYGLETNDTLDSAAAGVHEWTLALRRGPVLATGRYGWGSVGVGEHVIVIVGISRTDKLVYLNPNMVTLLTHPRHKESYMTIADVYRLRTPSYGVGGPFWQVAEDLVPDTPPRLEPVSRIQPNWGIETKAGINQVR